MKLPSLKVIRLKPGFNMIATIAAIAGEKESSAIIWKSLSMDRSDNDRRDRTFFFFTSAIVVAAIAGKWFLYDRCDC